MYLHIQLCFPNTCMLIYRYLCARTSSEAVESYLRLQKAKRVSADAVHLSFMGLAHRHQLPTGNVSPCAPADPARAAVVSTVAAGRDEIKTAFVKALLCSLSPGQLGFMQTASCPSQIIYLGLQQSFLTCRHTQHAKEMYRKAVEPLITGHCQH